MAGRRGLLDLDTEVRSVVPRLSSARYTARDLLEHHSGLLRVPWQMLVRPARDPYRRVRDRPLPERWTRPIGDRGAFVYSNTGYAVLGEVLDTVTGSWWSSVRDTVPGAGRSTSLTLEPGRAGRALLVGRSGVALEPWSLAEGPFASAGGAWSTFDDLTGFAQAATREEGCPPGWARDRGADLIIGATRDARAIIVRRIDDGRVAVVHSLGLGPATDAMAVELLRQED
ncbi:serine hydrolase [Curtobacterium sp. Leaf261]|uniref:serine hydrolase n=1 Tax=Curtobacterium sp. Leaf261 TaxID=1736311 RepID=UPI0006F7C7E8|nr:serine hydrolase domain-containing protein [Curtobacterium sp. Leaf261]KQO61246.1 hypothetical protein ASF23_12190 [Curtobacterium sp. Leaf261]